METDDKGKIFTKVVHKEAIQVLIQTRTNQIRGTMYKRPNRRMTDKLNDEGAHFIPITDAVILDLEGKAELLRTSFLELNRNEIIWLIEQEAKT